MGLSVTRQTADLIKQVIRKYGDTPPTATGGNTPDSNVQCLRIGTPATAPLYNAVIALWNGTAFTTYGNVLAYVLNGAGSASGSYMLGLQSCYDPTTGLPVYLCLSQPYLITGGIGLFLNSTWSVASGSTITILVQVSGLDDAVNSNYGLSAASIDITFDDTKFSFSTANVALGNVPGETAGNGWTITAYQPASDSINMTIFTSGSPILTYNAAILCSFQLTAIGAASTSGFVNLNATTASTTPITYITDIAFNAYTIYGPSDGTSSYRSISII